MEQIYNQIKPDTLTFWEGVFNVSIGQVVILFSTCLLFLRNNCWSVTIVAWSD